MKKIAILLLLAISITSIDGCRPKAAKNRAVAKKKAATAPTVAATTTGVSAQQVMSRADSVLARVSLMSREERDVPPVNADDYPKTPWGTGYVPKPDLTAYSNFEAGLASFNGGEYEKAIESFSEIVTTGRPPELVPNAYYWIGESYYAMQRYAEAIPYFEYTVQIGPQFKRESAMYKLARVNFAIGNTQAASMWYERLRTEYPKSQYSGKLKKLGVQ